jgi:hypothetical protein
MASACMSMGVHRMPGSTGLGLSKVQQSSDPKRSWVDDKSGQYEALTHANGDDEPPDWVVGVALLWL